MSQERAYISQKGLAIGRGMNLLTLCTNITFAIAVLGGIFSPWINFNVCAFLSFFCITGQPNLLNLMNGTDQQLQNAILNPFYNLAGIQPSLDRLEVCAWIVFCCLLIIAFTVIVLPLILSVTQLTPRNPARTGRMAALFALLTCLIGICSIVVILLTIQQLPSNNTLNPFDPERTWVVGNGLWITDIALFIGSVISVMQLHRPAQRGQVYDDLEFEE